MHAQLAINYTQAVAALRANLTPRQVELDTLERYVEGTQYEGRPDFFTDDVPMWHRAPCIVYLLVASAISSNVDLVLGESRFPTITANPGENDTEADGLDEDQSRKVDRALSELFTRTRLKACARQAFEHAQGERSVATIACVRNGIPKLENVKASWCTPTLDSDGNCTRLEIRYPYLDWEKQADGKWKLNPLLYKRVIDGTRDVEYKPVPADPDGVEPKDWAENPDRSKPHGLGFCPVIWYAHMKECATLADFDGRAIHEKQLDEIRQLDFALSTRHRAAIFTGNPPIIETGVDTDVDPAPKGVTSGVGTTLYGGKPSGSNPVTGEFKDAGKVRGARIISPGVVWRYGSDKVKVVYLTLPAGALEALDEDAADLRNKIIEGLAVVPLDPENVKFAAAMSGKAIETLRARQFDRCDQYRDDFGDGWILPVVKMLLRVALKTKIRLKSVRAVANILSTFVADDDAAPMLSLRWDGSYTKPDPTDEGLTITAVVAAYTGKLITRRMALQKLSGIFGISNVDQAEAALEEEVQKAQEEATRQMQEAAGALHGPPGEKKKPKPVKNDAGTAAAA